MLPEIVYINYIYIAYLLADENSECKEARVTDTKRYEKNLGSVRYCHGARDMAKEQENRKQILSEIIKEEYFDYYSVSDPMMDLMAALCLTPEENLLCADLIFEIGSDCVKRDDKLKLQNLDLRTVSMQNC